MSSIFDKEELTGAEIQSEVFRRMEKYEQKSFGECFSLYLGIAQLLEFGLKKVLEEKFNIPIEETEKLSLGNTRGKLESLRIRSDYNELLKKVVKDRNYAAHTLLANQALISSLGIEISERMEFRELKQFIFVLEQAVLLFDYIQHNDAWLLDT